MKKRGKIRRRFLLFILLPALLLSGCGAPGRDGRDDTPAPVLAAYDPDAVIDDGWKRDGFVCRNDSGFPFPVGTFRELRYLELEETAPEFSFSSNESAVAYLRGTRYELTVYAVPDDMRGTRYFLDMRGPDEETSRRVELFTDGALPPDGCMINMDVVTEADIAVLFLTENNEYRVIHLDDSGRVLSSQNLAFCFSKQQITTEELCYHWWCDEQGNSYVVSAKQQLLYIYDGTGGLLMTHQLSAKIGETVPCVCHAPDGSLLFGWNLGQEFSVVRFDLEARAPKTLATLPIERLWRFSMEKDGRFLLVDDANVWLWNGISGEITCLFNHSGSDIESGNYIYHAAATPDGLLLLYVWGSDEKNERLYVLSDRAEEAGGITLVNFTSDVYVQQSVALFNRGQEEEEKILYSAVNSHGQDREDYWTRLMASFAAGKGPDILCVYAEDEHLDALWEKGILADLDGWIPRETLDQIFPGLLACGILDGKLVGVCETQYPPCMVVTTDGFCPSGRWSQQEALEKVRESPDLETLFFDRDGMHSALLNLDFLVLRHLEASPFIDWEKGESRFEGEEFQEILEVCGGTAGAQSDADRIIEANERYRVFAEAVRNDRCMAYERYAFHFGNYRDYKNASDSSWCLTGYPGQTDYTGYWSTAVTLIVVNARTEHPEAIAEFLRYYLSAESMGGCTSQPIARADVFKESLLENIDYNSYTEEEIDGYIEEVLCRAGPVPRANRAIADIIMQEAALFFSGERDAARTAEVIDNRVQLYLNERRQ